MAMSKPETPSAFLPNGFGQLLIATALPMSVAMSSTNVVRTNNSTFHIPVITEDVNASWVAELAEIAESDATLDEAIAKPRKIAALTKLSNELVNDSSPAASQVVGESIARDLARKIDETFLSTNDGLGVPPKGLGAFKDTEITTITAGTKWENADPFTNAMFAAETIGATLNTFIANPADALTLPTLERETGSNEPLLAVDATEGATRRISGVALKTSPFVPAGTIYGLDSTRVFTVVREDVTVRADESVFFTSDATALRGIARVDFAYPHAKSIVRIKLAAA